MQYRKQSQETELVERNKKEYARITAIAKSSPKAGLAEMGRLLEKYYSENNSYPSTLVALYPQYLENRALIEEVDWEYKPGKDNFILKKHAVVDGKNLVAVIDRRLKPLKEKTIVVAEAERTDSAKQKSISDIVLAHIDDDKGKKNDLPKSGMIEPEFVLIKETEIEPGFEKDMSYKCLFWKNENGILGFGNIEYPRSTSFSVFHEGKRYDLKRSQFSWSKMPVSYKDPKNSNRETDSFPSDQNKEYLLWKSRNGTPGFGNIQYPENNDKVLLINVEGAWQKIGK